MRRLIIAALLLLLVSGVACAHRVHIQPEVGRIDIKVYFGGGDPAQNFDVKVYRNVSGVESLYAEGKTNETGWFSFEPTPGGTWRVVAEGLGGHRAETVIDGTVMGGAGSITGEVPLYLRVIAGIGYLVGLAGAATGYMGWKARKGVENDSVP